MIPASRVAALGGAPGVVSARWAGAAKDFSLAMQRVQDEAGAAADRRAWFTAALCLAWPDGETTTFLGRVEGTRGLAAARRAGLRLRPDVRARSAAGTYGEMDPAEKHATSHRARAFAPTSGGLLRLNRRGPVLRAAGMPRAGAAQAQAMSADYMRRGAPGGAGAAKPAQVR